jgi:hypothetical protein
MSGDYRQRSRTNVVLPEGSWESIRRVMPVKGPGDISRWVFGPAYIFAILTHERITS